MKTNSSIPRALVVMIVLSSEQMIDKIVTTAKPTKIPIPFGLDMKFFISSLNVILALRTGVSLVDVSGVFFPEGVKELIPVYVFSKSFNMLD